MTPERREQLERAAQWADARGLVESRAVPCVAKLWARRCGAMCSHCFVRAHWSANGRLFTLGGRPALFTANPYALTSADVHDLVDLEQWGVVVLLDLERGSFHSPRSLLVQVWAPWAPWERGTEAWEHVSKPGRVVAAVQARKPHARWAAVRTSCTATGTGNVREDRSPVGWQG